MRLQAALFDFVPLIIVMVLSGPIGRAGEADRGYSVWTETSMTRIIPRSQPPADDAPSNPQARIALAGREYESFQIALRPAQGSELHDIRIKVGNLVCAAHGSQIMSANIQWHQVGYVRLERIIPHPADPGAIGGWWPDPLLPVEKFNVAPQFTQAIWVTVYAPPGTPAGKYKGELTICPEGLRTTVVDVSATVYGFDLPLQGHLKTAFALMDGYLETVYGRPLAAELRHKYGDLMLAHRLNPDDVSRTAPPSDR